MSIVWQGPVRRPGCHRGDLGDGDGPVRCCTDLEQHCWSERRKRTVGGRKGTRRRRTGSPTSSEVLSRVAVHYCVQCCEQRPTLTDVASRARVGRY